MLDQRVPALSDLSVFEIMNGYQAPFFSYQVMKIYKIIAFIRRRNTSKIRPKVSITTFSINFFISKLDIPTSFLDIFTIMIIIVNQSNLL